MSNENGEQPQRPQYPLPDPPVTPVAAPEQSDEAYAAALNERWEYIKRTPALLAAMEMMFGYTLPTHFDLIGLDDSPQSVFIISTPAGVHITFWERSGLEAVRAKIDAILGDRGDLIVPSPKDVPGLFVPGQGGA